VCDSAAKVCVLISAGFTLKIISNLRGDQDRGKSPIMERFPNMGRCIISYQEVLRSEVKNVNRQADEAILSQHSINGQLLRTSVLTGRLCFGAP
jgi:hypothetical protein